MTEGTLDPYIQGRTIDNQTATSTATASDKFQITLPSSNPDYKGPYTVKAYVNITTRADQLQKET